MGAQAGETLEFYLDAVRGYLRIETLYSGEQDVQTVNCPVVKIEHIRTSAFDPNGTHILSQSDMRQESGWVGHLSEEDEGEMRHIDIVTMFSPYTRTL